MEQGLAAKYSHTPMPNDNVLTAIQGAGGIGKLPIRSDAERLAFYMNASGDGRAPEGAFIHGTYNPEYKGAAMDAGALKGPGFLGNVSGGKSLVTEYAMGVPAGELVRGAGNTLVEIPTIVPTLTNKELGLASRAANARYDAYGSIMENPRAAEGKFIGPKLVISPEVEQKAINYARQRIKNGMSPYVHAR